jgi:hypothetical protein
LAPDVPAAAPSESGFTSADNLSCRDDDLACGKEAASVMDRMAASLKDLTSGEADVTALARRCAQEVLRGRLEGNYWNWRDCIDRDRVRVAAFPVGRFSVPHEGWLIFGEAGGNERCGSLYAFDVATGVVVFARTCDGGRDEGRLGRARATDVRELALVTGLAPLMRFSRPSLKVKVPKDLRRSVPDDRPWQGDIVQTVSAGCGACLYDLTVGGAQGVWSILFHGRLRTAESDGAGERFVLELRERVLASSSPACATVELPLERYVSNDRAKRIRSLLARARQQNGCAP